MSKPQQRFGSGTHNVFTEEFNKTGLSANSDKRIHQQIQWKHMYLEQADIVIEKEQIKCNKTIKQSKKIINFCHITKENIKEHNPSLLQIEYSYRIIITGGSRSGKTKSLFNLISHKFKLPDGSYYLSDIQSYFLSKSSKT